MTTKSEWELLGIEPTTDIRQIKKAYAKNLKLCSPEDDPVQFQILRQVYDKVLRYAKYADSAELTADTFHTEDSAYKDGIFYDPFDKEPGGAENRYDKTGCFEDILSEPEMEELKDVIPAYERFMQQVEDLYANFESRLDPKKWDEIIKDEVLWDVETYRNLKTWFLDFLYSGHYVPSEVMQSYNKYFSWELYSEEYHQKYGDIFLTYIKEQIDGIIVPGYEYLMQASCKDMEAYIRYRENGFAQYLSADWNNIDQNIMNALEMIPNDPYLLCILGAYNEAVYSEDGKKYIKSGAELSMDPWRMFLFSGQLMHHSGKCKEALRYYKKIPKGSNYYITAQSGIVNCLCKMKKYHKCGFSLRSRLKKSREDTELKDVLSQYYAIILDLKKSFPNRLVFWYEARKTFSYVRNCGEKNPHKFTMNYILSSLKLIAKIMVVLFLLMTSIATRGGILSIVVIYKLVCRKKH